MNLYSSDILGIKAVAFDQIAKAARNEEFCDTYARAITDLIDALIEANEKEKED